MILVLTFVLLLLVLVRMRISLTPHVSIQDSHEIASKVSNLSAFDTGQFVNRQEGILFREHSKLHPDLLAHFFIGTKLLSNQLLNPQVDGGSQGHAHASFFSCRSTFLDADITLNDSKEVGSMIANGTLFDFDSIVVLGQSIVDQIGR